MLINYCNRQPAFDRSRRTCAHVRVGLSVLRNIFTARRHPSAVYSVVVCPSVCPFVCPPQAGIVSKRLDESSWFLAGRFPSTYPTLCCKEIWYLHKLGYFPLGLCPKLRKISPRQVDRVVNKLIDVAVDGRVCRRHLYDN